MSSFLPTGPLVVFHDATLGRMCGIDRRVNELTFAELRQLSLVNTKEHIPSFQEALALVNGKVPLLVELKMEHLDFDIPPRSRRPAFRIFRGLLYRILSSCRTLLVSKKPPADFPRAAFHQFQY